MLLRESSEGRSSVCGRHPRGPLTLPAGGLPWTRAWSSPAGEAATPNQPCRPRGRASGIPQLWLPAARVHITCSPGTRPCCCLRHRRLGSGGQGPSCGAEPRGASGRLTLTPNSGTIRGWRATCHPRRGSLIHTRNHGTHLLPAHYTRRTNIARVADSLT